jgi:hypothetical protein
MAAFEQGFEAHSLMLVWQKGPEKPAAQLHENELKASLQEAPLRQGEDEHSFTVARLISQRAPTYG